MIFKACGSGDMQAHAAVRCQSLQRSQDIAVRIVWMRDNFWAPDVQRDSVSSKPHR